MNDYLQTGDESSFSAFEVAIFNLLKRQTKKGAAHDIDIDIPVERKMCNPAMFNVNAKSVVDG